MIAFYKDGLEKIQADYDFIMMDPRFHFDRVLREPKRTIHYYYPLDLLQEEVYKRTSMIGKHRFTNNGDSRLDELALTQDEDDTFNYLISDSAREVFEKIIPYTNDKNRCFIYDDGTDNTISMQESNGCKVTVANVTYQNYNSTSGSATTPYDSFICNFDVTLSRAMVEGEKIVIKFKGSYKVNNFMAQEEEREFEYTFEKAYSSDDTKLSLSFVYVPELDTTTSTFLNAESFISVVSSEVDGTPLLQYVTPSEVKPNTWVDYEFLDGTKGVYYSIATSDTNTSPLAEGKFIDLTEYDLRHSVHYIVDKPIWIRENSVDKTDKSIFEALVAYVIYKWFAMVLPSEAEYYAGEYMRRLTDVKYNLGFSERMSVISHPF